VNGNTPHWGTWATVAWGVFIALFFLIVQVAATFVGIASTMKLPEEVGDESILTASADGGIIAVSTLATGVLGTALIAGVIKLKRHSVLRDYLGLRAVPQPVLLKWLGFLAAFLVVSAGLNFVLGREEVVEFMRTAWSTAESKWMLWLALVVGAPLFEETFFRGFLFKGLAASRFGTLGAIVLPAALWAAIHLQYDYYEMASIFLLGLLLGAARARTGSLLTPLLMHAATNFLATVETAIVAT
jgi:membrane protease YdiL (CAAX protease family)